MSEETKRDVQLNTLLVHDVPRQRHVVCLSVVRHNRPTFPAYDSAHLPDRCLDNGEIISLSRLCLGITMGSDGIDIISFMPNHALGTGRLELAMFGQQHTVGSENEVGTPYRVTNE